MPCGQSNLSNLVIFFLSDISKVQDDEVGDGTTSVTVLAAELLRVRRTLLSRLPTSYAAF